MFAEHTARARRACSFVLQNGRLFLLLLIFLLFVALFMGYFVGFVVVLCSVSMWARLCVPFCVLGVGGGAALNAVV